MEGKAQAARLKARCVLAVSPVYEVFHAMGVCLDRRAPVHANWAQRARSVLEARCPHELAVAGNAFLWTLLPDTLGAVDVDIPFDDIASTLAAKPIDRFAFELFEGVFHADATARELTAGRITVEEAVARTPSAKREWLGYIGLFPYNAQDPTAIMLDSLRRDPGDFRDRALSLLTAFWRGVFEDTWRVLRGELERRRQEQAVRLATVTLPEFLARNELPIEANAAQGYIQAIRGGYTVPYGAIDRLYFLPSAFNWRHLWSAFGRPETSVTVYVPLFEPEVTVEGDVAWAPSATPTDMDPALVFRALGDPTRFALASLIARREMTSAELARRLGVTRATITHHVHVMRAAGLIAEQPNRGANPLRLRRDTLERLSAVAAARLFGDPPGPAPARSSGKRIGGGEGTDISDTVS